MYELKKQAFTLVELIVVITILAILGTIAFISLQGYSKDARDSTRISDLSAMKTSLELFQLDAGKYPDPTDGFVVFYSGSEVWTQGIFGTTTFSNISKLDKIPKDPLTDKEYTYSVTKTKQEYQFAGIIEGDEIALNLAISQTNAGDLIATALVTGTYNGQIIKIESGTNCNILSLPSIISSEANTTTDLSVILTNKSLVFNGYNNLPTNYIASKYKTDGGFEFISKKVLVYDDSASCKPLYNPEDNTARIELITNLQEAYSGTLIENEDNISGIVNLDLTDTSKLDVISATLVNNDLGGNIPVTSGGEEQTSTNSCNSTQPTNATLTIGTPTSPNQTWQSSNSSNSCYFTCNVGYGSTGTSCVLASNCGDNGAIEITLTNGQIWSCMNLGATTVRDGTTQSISCYFSAINCNEGISWLGNYYQWGRNNTEWTDGQSISPYNNGWEVQNDTKWGGNVSDTTTSDGVGTTAIGRQGPCPSGRHVPSVKDWQDACNTILGTTCIDEMVYNSLIATKLRLPFAGERIRSNGYYDNWINAKYWSSSPYFDGSYNLNFNTSNMYPVNYGYRANGYSVRCIKN